MKPILSIIFLVFALGLSASAQDWSQEWEQQTGENGLDYFADVCETNDGGFAVLGCKGNGSSADLWLLRFNKSGEKLWNIALGGPGQDLPEKVLELGNGDLLVLGKSGTGNTATSLLVRTNSEGRQLWAKMPASDRYFEAHDMGIQKNGGILLAGGKGADPDHLIPWIARLDDKGELSWEKTYGTVSGCFSSVKELPNLDLVLGGQMAGKSVNDCDMLVIRTDEEGNQRWMNHMKAGKSKEWTECVCCSPDSCFMLVGWIGNCLNEIDSEYPIFDFDLVLKKIDCNGKELWSKNFDAEGSEGGNAIAIRPDGHFLIAGTKLTSFSGKVGPWLLEVDDKGNILKEMLLSLKLTQACKVINCRDGGFVVVGPGMNERINNFSDGWIAKFAEL